MCTKCSHQKRETVWWTQSKTRESSRCKCFFYLKSAKNLRVQRRQQNFQQHAANNERAAALVQRPDETEKIQRSFLLHFQGKPERRRDLQFAPRGDQEWKQRGDRLCDKAEQLYRLLQLPAHFGEVSSLLTSTERKRTTRKNCTISWLQTRSEQLARRRCRTDLTKKTKSNTLGR